MPIAYLSHDSALLHDMGDNHPERPARLHAIREHLEATRLMPLLQQVEAMPATRAQLLRVHHATHVERLFTQAPQPGAEAVMLDGDTRLAEHSLDAALHAAGAGILATDLVLSGKVKTAFCAARPPGHHAERDRAMGFCFFNNIAVAAAHALEVHGLERIAILDFDAHHGNGTEDIFRDDPRVLFCSAFQHPFYPATPLSRRPHIVHTPLPAGAGSEDFQRAITAQWLPAIDAFRPQLILVSAGFDAHQEDWLSGLNLMDADYAWITGEIMRLAAAHCRGRVVSILEGGYALGALSRSVAAHLRILAGVH